MVNRALRRHHAARVRARKRHLVTSISWCEPGTSEVGVRKALTYAHKSRAERKFVNRSPWKGELTRDVRAVPAPDFPEPVLHANLVPHRDYWWRRGTACERMADAFRSEIEWDVWERELEDDVPLVDMDAEDDIWRRAMPIGELMVQRPA